MKDVNIIIQINKNEAKYLVSKGCKFHKDIFKTIGCSGGKYYMKESQWLLNTINNYRESIKVDK